MAGVGDGCPQWCVVVLTHVADKASAATACLFQDMCKTERRKAGLKELCAQLEREVRMALGPVAKYVDQVGGLG